MPLSLDIQQASIAEHWWQKRRDDALLRSFGLSVRGRLQATSITSAVGRALQMKSAKFSPISSVSPDGLSFPKRPEDFRAEVLRQASEQYSNRATLEMDVDRLLQGCSHARPQGNCQPDLNSALCQHEGPSPLSINAPMHYLELWVLRAHCSDATSVNQGLNT